MENQLISFETAELAYKKGYDLKGAAAYMENGINSIRTNSTFYTKDKYPINITTQALLQKWLREKYRIHVEIPHYIEGYGIEIHEPKTWDEKDVFVSNIQHKTYEEALEIGLQEGLKLI